MEGHMHHTAGWGSSTPPATPAKPRRDSCHQLRPFLPVLLGAPFTPTTTKRRSMLSSLVQTRTACGVIIDVLPMYEMGEGGRGEGAHPILALQLLQPFRSMIPINVTETAFHAVAPMPAGLPTMFILAAPFGHLVVHVGIDAHCL
jgi:hypothetical protein